MRFTADEAESQFNRLATLYSLAYRIHEPDIQVFVKFAKPKLGESVLDLGTGSGWVVTAIKQQVGYGICVGVDIAKELLMADTVHTVKEAGFTPFGPANFSNIPSSSIANSGEIPIHLLSGNIMKKDLFIKAAELLPKEVDGFDIITALWVFETLPLNKQEKTLQMWKTQLSKSGRIVLSWAYLVEDIELPAAYVIFKHGGSSHLQTGKRHGGKNRNMADRCRLKVTSHQFLYHRKQHGMGDFDDQSTTVTKNIKTKLKLTKKKRIPDPIIASELRTFVETTSREEGPEFVLEYQNLGIIVTMYHKGEYKKTEGSSSKQRKRQCSEHQPQVPQSKRRKLAPRTSTYWDILSKIWLTKCALAELDRRNISEEQGCLYPQLLQPQRPLTRALCAKLTQQLEPTHNSLVGFAPKHIKSIKQLSRAGGPDLSDLRNRSARLPPSNSRRTKTATRTTSTVYSRNFEQKLIENGIFPDEYEYPGGQLTELPSNWSEINGRLTCQRASLSPSKFNDDDFRKFRRADAHASKENPVTTSVIPTIEGEIGDTKCVGGGYQFGNLAPLINRSEPNGEQADTESDGEQPDSKPELAQTTPDRFYGARPEQLERPIRDAHGDKIIPSTQDNLPMLPNFFLEAKGPDGFLPVVMRQVLYDGALGARGMHALQSYNQEKVVYDNNARTISSTYHGGQLKLYTHHIIPSAKKGRESETIMTQLKGYSMTSDYETFVRGASAYRNLRDWAKGQRDEFIEAANERYLKPQSESQPTSEQGTISELTVTVDDVETSFESDEPEFHDTAQYSFACSFLDTEEEPQLHTDSGKASVAESLKGKGRERSLPN
ncbi:hypothetical protein FQN57_002485 [Myotisia sp. PD_48]|nr:hypothetical protein FQN57_002485 [Myotisia sp. PD_48]